MSKVYSGSEKDFLGDRIVVTGFVFEKVWDMKMRHSRKKIVLWGFSNQVLCNFFPQILSLFEHGMRFSLCVIFLQF